MSEHVTVGRAGRPHGLEGAFVVEDASDDPERFAPGARVWVDGRPVRVQEAKRAGGRLVVRLEEPVERGAVLSVPRGELPPPEQGSFYVADLVGLAVVEEGGRALGAVRDVLPGVANDALELEDGRLLPLVEDCVLSVDPEAGRIVVAPGFAEPS